jgi:hypothetical protein
MGWGKSASSAKGRSSSGERWPAREIFDFGGKLLGGEKSGSACEWAKLPAARGEN